MSMYFVINMAAPMLRIRSSRKVKGRYDSGDSDVQIDLKKDPAENLRDILVNVTNGGDISHGRRLSYLNNFVKLLESVSGEDKLGFTVSEIVCCFRVALVYNSKEVRAGCLRALRYLLRNPTTFETMLQLQVDILVVRCLDCCQGNDVERIQAMRFIRRILAVAPELFPQSLANVLVAIANDGECERDRMQRACLATLCELAIINTDVFAQAGGIATLIRNILDSQINRINESVIMTIMHLLNYPHTRCHLRSSLDVEQILAPFTDLNYKHSGETSEQQQSEEREAMFKSSRLAIISMLRSWPGMIRLCKPDSGGLHSLLNILCIPNEETRKHIVTLLFQLFHLPVPDWTDDFSLALLSADASHWQNSWSLSEGFVVEEAKVILPHLASSRTNLVENHQALLMSAFINAGLLESLVEVITSGSDHLATNATVLLGELLHLANRLLPPECSHHYHCLPTLMSIAAAFHIPPLQRNRANAAVNHLNTLHEMKKRGNVPRSLFLDHIMSHQRDTATDRKTDKSTKDDVKQFLNKDSEDSFIQSIRNSKVLTEEHSNWNWDLLSTIFKWSSLVLAKSEDANVVKFLRNIAYFYKPQSNLFCRISLDKLKARSQELQRYTIVGLQFFQFLVSCEEVECQRILSELVEDITECISEVLLSPDNSLSGQAVFSPHSLHTTLSQDYMLFLGKLSSSLQGEKILEKHGAFQYFLDLCSMSNHDSLLRLIITCLDYKRDGLARVILTKMLTSSVDSVRLYTTSHLRVLLRARIPYFHNWGMELLVMQLYDRNKAVALESVDIIDEACEDEANLHSLVQIRPTVLHMGDRGAILLTRFLSTTTGFKYLSEVNFVSHELQKWFNGFNKRYAMLVETQMNEAFTSYIKPIYEGAFVRRSRDERRKRDVFVPAHLYGQLVQHKGGAELIEEEDHLSEFCRIIHFPDLLTSDGVLTLKAALWAIGHIGSSNWGLKLLEKEEIIPDVIRLAEECDVFSVRGTCFNVLGLLAKTKQGSAILSTLGWESIRHSRTDYWPVVEEQDGIFNEKGLLRDSTSMSSFDSVSTRTDSPSPFQMDEFNVNQELQSLFFVGGDNSNLATSPKSTFFLNIDEKGEHRLATGAHRPPHLEGSAKSKNKDKIGFPLYQAADTDGYSKSNSGIRREIAANQDRRIPRTTDLRRVKTMPSIEGNNDALLKSPLQKIRSNSDSKTRSKNTNVHSSRNPQLKTRSHTTESAHPPPASNFRDRSQSLKFRSNSNESSGRGSAGSKSRSESFTTDTTQTSGVSSMISYPSSPHQDSSMTSLSTVMSGQTVKTVHSSDATRRQYNLHRTPSFTQRVSRTLPRSFGKNSGGTFETNAVFTSRRDANGYAALKLLQLHRRLSVDDFSHENEFDDENFTNAKFPLSKSSGSLTGYNSMPCLQSPKPNPGLTSAVGGYMGLCLPVDVHLIFHDDESLYRQNSHKLSDNCQSQLQVACVDNVRFTKHKNLSTSFPTLLPRTLSESSLSESYQSVGHVARNSLRGKHSNQTEDDVHQKQFCFLCSKGDTQDDSETEFGRLRSVSECEPIDNFNVENSIENGEIPRSPSSDVSAFSHLSSSRFISYNSKRGYQLLRKELMQFISNMCSSVRRKAQEQGLLNLKEKFPHIFEDICLYSDVCHTLATHTFRLSARRFIQELFQEVKFDAIMDVPQEILANYNEKERMKVDIKVMVNADT